MSVFDMKFGESILLKRNTDALLVDCGSKSNRKAMIDVISDKIGSPAKLAFMLTHFHDDHFKYFKQIAKKKGQADILYLPWLSFRKKTYVALFDVALCLYFLYTKKDFYDKEIILFEKDYNPSKITFVLFFTKKYTEEECIKLTEFIYYTKNNNIQVDLYEPYVFSLHSKATISELITSIGTNLHLNNFEINSAFTDKPIDMYFTQSTVNVLYCTLIPSKVNELILFNTNKIEYTEQISLYDCFTELSNTSEKCPVCKSHLTSKSIFTKLPYYFMLHLNRFNYNEQSKKYIKNIDYITYPQYINLIEYIDSNDKYTPYDFLYELQSVTFIVGSFEEGHYWSEVKANSSWFSCDDTKVIPLANYSTSSEAISFIYKRKK